MRDEFEKSLSELHSKMIEMGSLCERAIAVVAKALKTGDRSCSDQAGVIEEQIDRMERDIETLCLRMILKQQPVAGDLRQISAALKMITDMERIGDNAEDIAEFIRFLNGRAEKDCSSICLMAEQSIKIVTDSIEAYVKSDIELARAAIACDDVIDDYFGKTKQTVIGLIEQKSGDGEYLLDLLMVAKYLERIGDHAVNIAEWVVFSVTGSRKMQN